MKQYEERKAFEVEQPGGREKVTIETLDELDESERFVFLCSDT